MQTKKRQKVKKGSKIGDISERKNKMRYLAAIAIVCLMGVIAQADGFTLWGIAEQEFDAQAAYTGRVGYQFGLDGRLVEPFIGSTWRPNYNAEDGIRPPQVLTIGGLYHLPDLLDPANPLPIIPDILLTFLNEGVVARPYVGAQGTWNFFDEDAGFYGGITGLIIKGDYNDRLSTIAEVLVNDSFGDLSGVPDKWRLYIGVRYEF